MLAMSTLKGRPVQIISPTENHGFSLNEEALKEILLKKDVAGKLCSVVSVAGAFRKGKSFLLDFMLKYLNAEDSSSWMGSDEVPLEGFSWRGGSERDTSGILMWSEPFIVKREDGEEVVVLLMDTQGAFDTQSTVRDCATVFALSTMLSSVQVYNLIQNIQEDDLQHLQLFTEYGRLALQDSGERPFQYLHFLVRDWAYPYEMPFGLEGGGHILEKRLAISDKQHPELQSLRRHVRSCFTAIDCFLMPHPGLKVATSPTFDGRLSDIESEFKEQLKVFIPLMLSPSNVIVKQINGNSVTCRELLEFFKVYMKIYQGNELPEPKSMLEATAEANNLTAVSRAREYYTVNMEKICGGDKPYLHPTALEVEHNRCKEASLTVFASVKKMGGEEFSSRYASDLMKQIEDSFDSFQEYNDSKNVFAAARTPATIFSVTVFLYVVSGFFDLLGLLSVVHFLSLFIYLGIMMLIAWSYIRYSGEHRDFGIHLDNIAEFIWEKILRQLYVRAVQQGINVAMRTQTPNRTIRN